MAEPDYDKNGGIVNTQPNPAYRDASNDHITSKRPSYSPTEKFIIKRSKKIGYVLEDGKYKCREGEVPPIIRIGPTNRCTGRCTYCPRELIHTWGTGYMDFDLYKKIIDYAAANGVKSVSFGLWGEPLLHPKIFDMFDYAAKKGLKLVLSTNAILLSKEIAERLLDYPFEVIEISMDGFTDKEYKKSKQVDKFDRVKENTIYILALAKKKKSKICFNVHFVDVGHVSLRNRVKYIKFWKQQLKGLKHETAFSYEPHNWAGTMDLTKNMKFFDRLLMKWEIRKPCAYLKGLSINWDGTIFACANNPLKEAALGNIRDMDLKEAYSCEKRMAYLKENEKGSFKVPGCARCTVNSAHPLMYLKKRMLNKIIGVMP